MTEYEYHKERFTPSGANPDLPETIDIPDNAIGVTVETWGDPESKGDDGAWVTVRYLTPTGDDDA